MLAILLNERLFSPVPQPVVKGIFSRIFLLSNALTNLPPSPWSIVYGSADTKFSADNFLSLYHLL
jgi:hypothetical protein